MKKIKSIFLSLVLFTGLGFGQKVFALEAATPFVIDKLWISGAESAHYRIVDEEGPAHCTGGPTGPAWSYINVSDSGSKGKISAILLAYAQGKTVELSTETDADGYCHVVEFWVF